MTHRPPSETSAPASLHLLAPLSENFSNYRSKAPAMPPQFPSIQSFFGRSPSLRTPNPTTSSSSSATEADPPRSSSPGDGFSASAIDAVLHPSGLPKWNPPKEYPEVEIGALVPGPGCVTVEGRIVNFYDQVCGSKMPRAARGCLRCVVGDGTGFVVVGYRFRVLCWIYHRRIILTQTG